MRRLAVLALLILAIGAISSTVSAGFSQPGPTAMYASMGRP
jgi:hypothetical protein